jgi:hypothetical protein
MLRTNQRLVVLAENNGGGAPFYNRGFDLYQDTSYEVKSIDAFTCSLNRGSPTNPLFLLNHWIDHSPASQAEAAEANGYEFLLARAQQCQQERGHVPNIIAVNFSEVGDVVRVAAQLNGK